MKNSQDYKSQKAFLNSLYGLRKNGKVAERSKALFSLQRKISELMEYRGSDAQRLRVNDISVLTVRFTDAKGVSCSLLKQDPVRAILKLEMKIRIWQKRVTIVSTEPAEIAQEILEEQLIFLKEAAEHYTQLVKDDICHNIIEREYIDTDSFRKGE